MSDLTRATWVLDLAWILPWSILGSDAVVGPHLMVFVIVFAVLGGIETWLLARGRRRLGTVTPLWLRRGWRPGTR